MAHKSSIKRTQVQGNEQRRTIAVVGAGRTGTALARRLAALGYDVTALVARAAANARRQSKLITPAPALALGAAQLNRLPRTDLLFIATPDDLIEATARKISRQQSDESDAKGAITDRQSKIENPQIQDSRIAFHLSGALSSDALAPLRACGYAVGSLHPLISVSDAVTGAEGLSNAYFCIEGDALAVKVARRIVRELDARSFKIKTEMKPLYHAAALMAAGHAIALFDLTTHLLAECGLSLEQSRDVLLPLLASALENLKTQTPAQALTGTFARGDAATVEKHLDALQTATEKDETLRDATEIYRLLGLRSLELARSRGVDPRKIAEIERLIKRS